MYDSLSLIMAGHCEPDEEFDAANNGFNVEWGPGLRYGDPDSRACLSVRIEEFPSYYLSPFEALLVASGIFEDEGYDLGEVDLDACDEVYYPDDPTVGDKYAKLAARIADPHPDAEERVAHWKYLGLMYDAGSSHDAFDYGPALAMISHACRRHPLAHPSRRKPRHREVTYAMLHAPT